MGNISSGTYINSEDSISQLIFDMLYEGNNKYDATVSLGTWSSLSDVDNFFNTYNHANGYNGLKLGNYVTINDGTYNIQWAIAGFDCEHSRFAADGTLYDNGYGICMIPKKTSLGSGNLCKPDDTLSMGYIQSKIHLETLPAIANSLKNVLGDHLILRNVLLSDVGILNNEEYADYSATWTTAYLTLLSDQQYGDRGSVSNDPLTRGEANYELPISNYETNYDSCNTFLMDSWCRGSLGYNRDSSYARGLYTKFNSNNNIIVYYNNYTVYSDKSIYPMMYIR